MKLILVRHGEAFDGAIDVNRILTNIGIQQIEYIAKMLLHEKITVKNIYHSGKTRAKQTAQILQQQFASDASLEMLECLRPDYRPTELVNYLMGLSGDCLMVGHLPHIRDVSFELLEYKNTADVEKLEFNPGTTLIFTTDDQIHWKLDKTFAPISFFAD